MNIINFENIYVSYDLKPVLKDINLTIQNGEHWVILGSNGSGKSTLIKLISNDLHPNRKYPFTKEVFGKDRWSIFDLKKKLGIITNDLHNYFSVHGSFLTAYEVVLSGYYSSIGIFKHQDFSKEQHQKALEALEFLEILDIKDKKVSAMSTGQLRRSIIGRALIHNPEAFILDEPTVGLDIKAQYSFIKLIQKLSKNASIILVTHHLDEVFPEVSHVALVHNKTIYKKGLKNEVLTSSNLSEIFELDIELKEEQNRYTIGKIQ
ncbi:ABC transporter ATP-binding protein [Arcobacter sp. 15-2]|uniref:ABC transporter ATP-binding protein n=1 Tax=Arcobacter sp. 15-2 TaxID=3374109 RepID=UPI00399D2F66